MTQKKETPNFSHTPEPALKEALWCRKAVAAHSVCRAFAGLPLCACHVFSESSLALHLLPIQESRARTRQEENEDTQGANNVWNDQERHSHTNYADLKMMIGVSNFNA